MEDTAKNIQSEVFARLAGLVKGLAAPARITLLHLLAQGPWTVQAAAKMARLSVANTSQHLQKMAGAGLIVAEKRGVQRLYRLKTPQLLTVWESLQDLGQALDPWFSQAETRLAGEEMQGPDSMELIHHQLQSGDAILLDVRTAAESRATPIPRARAIPEQQLVRQIRTIPKGRLIYVVCRGRYCVTATKAVGFLRRHGYHAFRLRQSPFGLTRAINFETRN